MVDNFLVPNVGNSLDRLRQLVQDAQAQQNQEAALGLRREDLGLRRAASERATTNADRSFGLQQRQFDASQANADRSFGLQERRLNTSDAFNRAKLEFDQRKEAQKGTPVEQARRKEENKLKVKEQSEALGKARGAQSFLRKVSKLEELVKQAGDGAFGPVEGSSINQFFGRFAETNTQQLRDRIQAALSDLELDVARFKLKGQGQVTEAERKIARDTIGGLGVTNAATQLEILNALKGEAQDAIASAQGADTNTAQKGGRLRFNPNTGQLE